MLMHYSNQEDKTMKREGKEKEKRGNRKEGYAIYCHCVVCCLTYEFDMIGTGEPEWQNGRMADPYMKLQSAITAKLITR